MIIEPHLRRGEEAKNLRAGQFDEGSTRWIGAALLISWITLLLAPVLNAFQIGNMNDSLLIGVGGLAIMLGGLTLKVWAMDTLGAFFTRTLLVKKEQHIVQEGPYHFIRHPGYLGSILMFVGAAVATLNWIAVIVIAAAILTAYSYRIRAEEAMLQTIFGEEFAVYRTRSWRLIPLIY